uniref:Cytochrome c oxidase subunit 5A, mitochondrial n=1 Tax=Capra hircus TaxID=9925 RepID=A0A452FHE2_CAPHI
GRAEHLRRCSFMSAAAISGTSPRGLLHPALSQETGEECNTCWVTCFSTSGIDVQELRKGKNILAGYDLVPEPKITVAAYLCLNDFASTVHIIEIVKNKAGPHKEIYPCVLQELRPTLNELGISSPEELGLHKV